MKDITVFTGFGHVLGEVFLALLPLTLFFFVFQFIYLKLPKARLVNIVKGLLLTFAGLALFLQGVHIAFMPVGEEMGLIMGTMKYTWVLVPVGFVLGFVSTIAEPAVRILNHEVEKVSGGSIPQKLMLYTLSIGVAVSVALSMLRILMGISIWYFLIPGYTLALILMFFTSRTFASIAFDSGGVATGPMTVTFILSMCVGIASVMEGRNPLLDGFGMIALVALAPILSVLGLGLLFRQKGEEKQHDTEQKA